MNADLIFFKIAQIHKRYLVKIFKDISWLVLLTQQHKLLQDNYNIFAILLSTWPPEIWELFNSYTKFIKKNYKNLKKSLLISIYKNFAVRNAETRKVIRMIAWLGMLEFNETWYFVKCNICSSSPKWAWKKEKSAI